MGIYGTSKEIAGKIAYFFKKMFNLVLMVIFFLLPIAYRPEGVSFETVFTWLSISTFCTVILWLGASWYFTSHRSISKLLNQLNEEKVSERRKQPEDGAKNKESRLVWLKRSEIDLSNAQSLCFGIFLVSLLGFILVDGGFDDLRGEDRSFPTCGNGDAIHESEVMDGHEYCGNGEDENPLIELTYCTGLECNSVGSLLTEEYVNQNIEYVLLLTGITAITIPVLTKTWLPIREMKMRTATMERLDIGIFNKATLAAAIGSAFTLAWKLSEGRSYRPDEALEYTFALGLITLLFSFPYIAALRLVRRYVKNRILNFEFSSNDYSQIAEMKLVELNNGVFEIKLIRDSSEDSEY